MGLQQQYWEQILRMRLNEQHAFLTESQDLSAAVAANNTLNFAAIGARPTVVVNHNFSGGNLTKGARTDTALALALTRLDTQPTLIRDADAHGLPYDVNTATVMDHAEELRRTMAALALHSWAPSVQALATAPLVPATGDDAGGRLAMKFADFITMMTRFNALGVPQEGRIAVLHPDHYAQLMAENAGFFTQVINNQSGQAASIAGFKVYVSNETPKYFANAAASDAITRKAFGATAAGTDLPASVFFHRNRVIRAIGSINVAMDFAENRPEDKQNLFSAQVYCAFAAPSGDAIGAIYSPVTPTP